MSQAKQLTCRTCGGPIDHSYHPEGSTGLAPFIHTRDSDGDDGHEAVPVVGGNTAKHTPGPWFVFPNGNCVGGPTGPCGPAHADESNTAGIALCGMRLRTHEEQEANARLIAAAPDLLAALIEAEQYVELTVNYTLAGPTLLRLQAAIHKATQGA